MTSYSELKSKRKESLDFWIESAKQDFMISVHSLMSNKEISKSELAELIGCTQSYISKVIRGDANFTIETMVKIARALDSKLCIHLSGIDEQIRWMGIVESKASPKKSVKNTSYWTPSDVTKLRVSGSLSHA